jgi:hypothetical protein
LEGKGLLKGAALLVCSRFKLKFSPDKVDTMIVQAIALLDDLDKEINIYSMRVKVRSPLPVSKFRSRAARADALLIHLPYAMGWIGMVRMALPRDGQDHR